ncbi:MAG TPA: hypothetical protein VEA99_13465 [Gemmatimonadaceae bacterium]|nr:hypothetical protein [Gemmatimonadaceae bacterium]
MRRLLASAVLVVGSLLAGCGGDDGSPTEPTSGSIAGTYTLRTVNGNNLPFTILQVGADKIELMNETITVAEGGSFTQQGTVRLTESGTVTTESYADAGSYTRNGTSVTFRVNSDGTTITGTIANGSITAAADGFSLVYRK